jgi:16S rRNA (cytosine1402-N4)-methyltransferase
MFRDIKHQPVLLKEVISYLKIRPGGRYIDATVGSGGYAEEMIRQGGRILGIDRDPLAIERAERRLKAACPVPDQISGEGPVFKLIRSNFVYLEKVAKKEGFFPADGVVFDLGFASEQIEDSQRGFSFTHNGPLDMRMDPKDPVTAADLVNSLSNGRLYELFNRLGEEPRARAIASAVVSARSIKPILTTQQLVAVVAKVYGGRLKVRGLHVATKVFQALRMAVNQELESLELSLPQAVAVLGVHRRLAVVSFHSGEDRIVKNFLKNRQKAGEVTILTKRPVRPGEAEVKANPRSRSAKLRVGEKQDK